MSTALLVREFLSPLGLSSSPQISRLDAATVSWGMLVLVIGLSIRVVVSFFSVVGGNLTTRERLFVALAWLPKATVQAAIGPVAFDQAIRLAPDDPRRIEYEDLGLKILTIAVLVILITAPIGAIAIMLSAPKLLTKASVVNSSGEERKESETA